MSTDLSRRTRAEAGWPYVVLAAVGLLVHLQQLLGGRPYFRDSHQVYVPAKMWLAERLRSGELPLWWPWDGGGSSLIPQPVFSVFHPSTLLYVVLPFWGAFAGQDLLATLLALFGAYVLARRLGVARPAAVISGVLYGASGYLVCLSEHQFMKLSAGTMPWYLAATLIAERRRGAWLLAPSAAMGLLLLAGDPQIAILSSATGLVLLLARGREWRRSVLLSFVAPVGGAVLAAIQLGPSLDVLPDTERGHAMEYVRWATTGRHLLGFLAPIGHPVTDWVRSTFFGWAGVGLAFASLTGWWKPRRRRLLIALWGLTVASVWVSIGQGYGLHEVARAVVPLWSQLRYPMKSIVLTNLTLAILAGIGATQLWSMRLQRRSRVVVAAVACACFVLSAVFSGVGVELAMLSVSVVAALFLRARLAALVVAAQVVAFAMPLYPTAPKEYYKAPPLAQALQLDGVGLTGWYFDRPFSGVYGQGEWAAADRAGVGGLGTSLAAIHGLPCLTPSMPGVSWRVLPFFSPEHRDVTNSRLLGVFGVGDVVLQAPVDPKLESQIFGRESEFNFVTVHLRKRLPRAYVVRRARVVSTPAEALDAVTSPQFAPGREIIVEHDSAPAEWGTRPFEPAVPAEVLPRADARSVRVRATLPAAGFIVLNEAFYRGWTATLDGAPVPILPANGFVRAVEAPAGEHEVVFTFATPGLTAGAIVSAVAWAALTLLALRLRRRTA
jgi:hypothetical protein